MAVKRDSMFRFFRRKKSKEENKVSKDSDVVQDTGQLEELSDKAEEAQAIVEVPVVEPAVVEVAQPESLVSEPESEAEPQPVVQTQPEFESKPEPVVSEAAEGIQVEEPVVITEAEEKAELLAEELTTAPETPEPQEVIPVAESSQEAVAVEPLAKTSWMQRLRKGLSRTGSNIGSLFVGVKVNEELFEELETALLMADAGIEATESLLSKLRAKVKQERIEDSEQVKEALKVLLSEHLKPLEKSFMLPLDGTSVVMIAGVNGAGKTTSIGKLAHHFQASGASVLLAAGDTFRAAAREQLVEWGKRNNVAVISQDGGDPAAVAFDAVNAGKARNANVVMIDTAGRLPTQLHLMEELKKIKRVINKADNEAPHEVLLVVDGNTGQNVITQIKTFDAALGLTGLVVTKLDGTAKGGTLAAVAAGSQGVRPIPVYWIGVGESLYDLQPFSAAEFASALLD